MLAFLQSLVLYSTDTVPCDINADGQIAADFVVAGQHTGEERLNAEWLFQTPGEIEGPVRNTRGEPIISQALRNLRTAYGLDLPYLLDKDGDGFPDKSDPQPDLPGFLDGENSAR